MKTHPPVTWLLPVKDGMPYLPETLASIEAQTYRDWEVLAWDNGSTDGTVELLREWIPARLPGRVVTDRPMRLGASLAALVEECGTELCARIDADDVNLPERLERQVAFLSTHPEIAAVGTQTRRLDSRGVVGEPVNPRPTGHADILSYMLRGPGLVHPTALFRRSAVLDVGNYRNVDPVEDYDLWLRLAARHRLANLPEVLVSYRIHALGWSSVTREDGRVRKANRECFAANAPPLYGCTEAEALRLKSRRHPLAVLPLYRIAGHLREATGVGTMERMRSAEFVDSARRLVAPRDVLSRMVLALLDPAAAAPLRELRSIWRDARSSAGRRLTLGGQA